MIVLLDTARTNRFELDNTWNNQVGNFLTILFIEFAILFATASIITECAIEKEEGQKD